MFFLIWPTGIIILSFVIPHRCSKLAAWLNLARHVAVIYLRLGSKVESIQRPRLRGVRLELRLDYIMFQKLGNLGSLP